MNLLHLRSGAERIILKSLACHSNYSGDTLFSQDSGDIKSCLWESAGMLGRKGAFDDVCRTVSYKLFDLRIRFDADDYAACDIVVIVFSTMALSVVLKDSTMTMIFSLLLFGGTAARAINKWVPIVHYLSLNSLWTGIRFYKETGFTYFGNRDLLGSFHLRQIYLYRAYENRRVAGMEIKIRIM